jgi:hypothetical protein
VDLARTPKADSFGYVMALRDQRYNGLVDYLAGRVATSLRAVTTAGFGLAHSYHRLHARGLCYRDISYGNVFFDPRNGDVLICDNDNVGIDGRSESAILGTVRFMAPEVLRGQAAPSTRTDLHSLAVLLFYMLVKDHPLQGARELGYDSFDGPAFTDLFGSDPLFIFDPDDRSNEPVPGFHNNALTIWPLLPPLVQDLFVRAFTSGLHDPEHGRVAETEWKLAMVRLRDSIAYCGACGAQNFLDLYSAPSERPPEVSCWACGGHVAPPFRLRFKGDVVLLNHDTELYAHHVLDQRFEFEQPLARVEPHPEKAEIWGLRNLTDETWMATDAQGALHEVGPGRALRLGDGMRIRFPRAEAEILW